MVARMGMVKVLFLRAMFRRRLRMTMVANLISMKIGMVQELEMER